MRASLKMAVDPCAALSRAGLWASCVAIGLLVAFPGSVSAMCVAYLEVALTLRVESCQAIEFGQPWPESEPLPKPEDQRAGPETLDALVDEARRAAASQRSLSGTLIAGSATTDHLLLNYPPPHYPRHAPRREFDPAVPVALFLHEPAGAVCQVFEEAHEYAFRTEPLCCDVEPRQGLCMVPRSVTVVTRDSSDGWYEFQPERADSP